MFREWHDPVWSAEILKGRREQIIEDFMNGDSPCVLEARLRGIGYIGADLRREVNLHREARDALPIGVLAQRIRQRLDPKNRKS